METILSRIKEPSFRSTIYKVGDFGAKGDGKSNDLPAFTAAIQKANKEGGGTVQTSNDRTYVLEGPLHLLSNIHLQLGARTVLKFGSNPSHFLPPVLTKFEGTELYNYSPLIRAYNVTNVAVTGAGSSSIIDSSADSWFKKDGNDANKLRAMGNNSVPVSKRVFGAGYHLPPNCLEPFRSTNVLLDSFKILGSPFWTVHPIETTNVIVRNLAIETAGRINTDGCDPEGSTDVLIEGCSFHTGDDGIAIKAGRDADGWRIGRPTKNLVIRNNSFDCDTNALCIGSEISGGVENVYAHDNVVSSASNAIYFKSNKDRGSFVKDVDVWNTKAKHVGTCVAFTNAYHGSRGGDFPTSFSGFNLYNNQCDKVSKDAVKADGLQEKPMQDTNITHLIVPMAGQKNPEITNVINWHLSDVEINGKTFNKDYNPRLSLTRHATILV
jgi:polygalacturonase